jgi:hypothetical protein
MNNLIQFSEGKPSRNRKENEDYRGRFFYNTETNGLYIGALTHDLCLKDVLLNEVKEAPEYVLVSLKGGNLYSQRGTFGKDNEARDRFVEVTQPFEINPKRHSK